MYNLFYSIIFPEFFSRWKTCIKIISVFPFLLLQIIWKYKVFRKKINIILFLILLEKYDKFVASTNNEFALSTNFEATSKIQKTFL